MLLSSCVLFFFFQAEDGIRDLVRSRGLGDVYKRQVCGNILFRSDSKFESNCGWPSFFEATRKNSVTYKVCLLYTSDAADERSSVDLGGRRIIKKKKKRSEIQGSVRWTPYKLKNNRRQ